jgi:NTE family protein
VQALIDELSSVAEPVHLEPGDTLVEEGAQADHVFAVVAGRLEATARSADGGVVVGSVGAGEVVGEVTVIAGGRRTATLRATEPTDALVLPRAEFEDWLNRNPDFADEVSSQARERIDRGHVAAMVSELAGPGEHAVVQSVLDRVEWRHLEAGEVLFEEGDPSDAAYFIVGGRLMVSALDDDDVQRPIVELGRGAVVGELGLLDDAPRSATVTAIRDATLAVFPRAAFEELVMTSPALMLHVARGILTRLRRTPRRPVGRARTITVAVVAPDAIPGPAADLTGAIVDELARFGSVRRLSSALVDEVLSRPGIAQVAADNVGVPRLAELMHEADVGNDHVVLETDPELSRWTRRAVRQADRLVIVCSPSPDQDEERLVTGLLAETSGLAHVSVLLAVVHPAGAERPHGTAALLRRYGLEDVVHLRAGSSADVARLARLAGGHGVGLVLSGGGARGFAHLGAYRALLEAGVPIDAVAGCSIGAPLGAGIARGVSLEEMIEVTQRQFHRLLDYTLPIVALVKGQRITASIEETFDGWDIEDLWLRYHCVSTNLTQSRLEIHRRGNTSKAIRASVAIPGVLPPVPHEGDLLVDGGVINNLPVESMLEDGMVDTVIAVDVAPPTGPRARADYGLSVSGFRAVAASLRRGQTTYPSVTAVLLRSMLAGAVHNQASVLRGETVDLLLRMNLPGVSLLDFERVAEVADAGYRAAVDPVRAWASTLSWMTVDT